MALLVAMMLAFLVPAAQANIADMPQVEIFFDRGDPDQSIGLVGNQILGLNDMYDWLRVHAFEEDSIVFENRKNGERFKVIQRGRAKQEMRQRAIYEFIANQMKAIYMAQASYYSKYHEGYAEDLETLISQGYLADGFDHAQKYGYIFEITETGRTKRHAMKHENMPIFYAVASPINLSKGEYYFLVDYLGQVRYGDNAYHVKWGAVWDYYGGREKPKSYSIGVEES